MASVHMFALILLTVLSSGSTLRLQNRESEAPDLWEKLWDGMDMNPEEERQISQLFRRQVSGEEAKRQSKDIEHVQMLGPPDSGTHLLAWMLQRNFPQHVQGSLERVWKHSIGRGPKDGAEQIASVYESKHRLKLNRTTLFISTRSPVAQLMSWHKHGYGLVQCMDRDLDKWDTPCFAHTSPWDHDSAGAKLGRNTSGAFHFSSSMDVYNTYLRQYKQLQKLGKFKKVILLPMEDVVLTPKETFEMVAKKLGWSLPKGGVRVLEGKAKKFDGGYGRQEALEKLSARPFLELAKFSTGKSAVKMICKKIDRKAIKGLTEGSFTDSPRPYDADCKGHH